MGIYVFQFNELQLTIASQRNKKFPLATLGRVLMNY